MTGQWQPARWMVVLSFLLLVGVGRWHGPFARSPKVVVQEEFVLKANAVLDEDLIVLQGTATLEEGSVVRGHVLAFASQVTIAGTVTGDVVAYQGTIELQKTAVVRGKVSVVDGVLRRAKGARVEQGIAAPITPSAEGEPVSWRSTPVRWAWRAVRSLQTTLAWVLFAALAALLVPRPLQRVGEAYMFHLRESILLGLGVLFVAPLLVLLLVILVLGIPLAAIVFVGVGLAWFFGLLAMGWLVGERVLSALGKENVHPVWVAALGMLILHTALNLLRLVSLFHVLLWLAMGIVAVGAVFYTRFGTSLPASLRDWWQDVLTALGAHE